MRKVLALLTVFLLTGCMLQQRTSMSALGPSSMEQSLPPPPLQEWDTIASLSLTGAVSSRLAVSPTGDLYYAYAETMLAGDNPATGLPAIHVVSWLAGATASSEFTAPSIDPATTTAAVLALQVDGSGNLYLMVQTTSTLLYRYAAGTTTPSPLVLPTSFTASTTSGAGFHVDSTSGTLYIAGTDMTASGLVATVALSTDGGANWALKDASTTNGTVGYGVTAGSSGAIYLAGAMPAQSGSGTAWVLYSSSDGGTTFNTLDSYQPSGQEAGAASRAEYVVVDGAGHFYTAGSDVIDPATLGTATVVRESTDGGDTWSETSRFSAQAFPGSTTDSELGLMAPQALSLGVSGMAFLPVLEAKAPSSYLLVRTPVLGGTWATSLAITSQGDGQPLMQDVQFDQASGRVYLLTNYFKYAARQSTLTLTRF